MTKIGREKGLFITFEGTEGCGKTTQFRLLIDRARAAGHTVIETAEPGGTSIGRQIRKILLDPANEELGPTAELLLYFAARAQNVDELVNPALARGELVISDRWTDSSWAYQGTARKLGTALVEQLDTIACRGLQPHLTICLDIDLDTGLRRARSRNLETQLNESRLDDETREFHSTVKRAYSELAKHHPERFRIVDANRTIDELAADIWKLVEERK